jgi:hypothetical protein
MPKLTVPEGEVPTGKVTASGKPGMRKANWWDHTGPLAVVFAGGPDSKRGTSYSPSASPGDRARVEHFLADPRRWH